MGIARDHLLNIVDLMNQNAKALQVFVTNINGMPVNWNKAFQFKLDNEEPFYLDIKEQKVTLNLGILHDAEIEMIGDPNSIVKICQGKGDFTHGISREEIRVIKGKVIDVIRLTRAITIVLKSD